MQVFVDLATSKKFLMMVIGLIVWFAGRYGFSVDPTMLYPPLGLIVAYIAGQAYADKGKSAALVAAANAPPAEQPPWEQLMPMVGSYLKDIASRTKTADLYDNLIDDVLGALQKSTAPAEKPLRDVINTILDKHVPPPPVDPVSPVAATPTNTPTPPAAA